VSNETLVFDGTGSVREKPLHSEVRMLVRVVAVHDYDAGPFGRLWAALLEDQWGALPAFGFESPPEVGATIIVVGTVTGWDKAAMRDPEFVEELIRDRGFADEVEVVVSEWLPASAVFAHARKPSADRAVPSGGEPARRERRPEAQKVDDATRIAEYWRWFSEGPGRWPIPGKDIDEFQLGPVLHELQKSFPEVFASASVEPSVGFVLELSAQDMRREAAPVIRALVAAAPQFKSWRFQAFQKPHDHYDLSIGHLGLPWDALPHDQLRVEVTASGTAWDLRVYVPGYARRLVEPFKTAVSYLLEALMGEAWLLEDLGALEIADLRRVPARAAPIMSLPEILSRARPPAP
jgi:hypothetical protein